MSDRRRGPNARAECRHPRASHHRRLPAPFVHQTPVAPALRCRDRGRSRRPPRRSIRSAGPRTEQGRALPPFRHSTPRSVGGNPTQGEADRSHGSSRARLSMCSRRSARCPACPASTVRPRIAPRPAMACGNLRTTFRSPARGKRCLPPIRRADCGSHGPCRQRRPRKA